MAEHGFRNWLERHPLTNALLVIGMGAGLFALLLPRLREALDVLDFYFHPDAGRESVLRGLVWLLAIAAGFSAAVVVWRRWWTTSRIRTWLLRVLVAFPFLG